MSTFTMECEVIHDLLSWVTTKDIQERVKRMDYFHKKMDSIHIIIMSFLYFNAAIVFEIFKGAIAILNKI